MGDEPAKTIKAVQTSHEVLSNLRRLGAPTLNNLDSSMKLSKTSIHNHLNTLLELGYIRQEDNRYMLDIGQLQFAGYARDHHPLYLEGVMYAVQLAQRTGEIASISTEHMNQQMTIFVVRGDQGLKTETRLGNRSPMHQTASGKAMLALMSEERQERILDAMPLEPGTEHTITDINELLSELEEIHQQGYGFNDEERRSGVRAVAAPITNRRSKELVGALAISGPTTRLKGQLFEDELPNLLREYSDMIEVNITEW